GGKVGQPSRCRRRRRRRSRPRRPQPQAPPPPRSSSPASSATPSPRNPPLLPLPHVRGCRQRYLVMSAAVDSARKRCSCGSSKWQNLSTKCLNLKCSCFKDGVHCMRGRCKCKGCENNPYDLAYEGGKGCTCKSNKCKIMTCGCRERGARCTLECSCQGCENGKGTGGGEQPHSPLFMCDSLFA
uniref:CRC domain-containing protein n=1 Tax=Aegilops tauschii subsp. strangulata TaxID=200361 RepID=A0A453A2F5_AEGTS